MQSRRLRKPVTPLVSVRVFGVNVAGTRRSSRTSSASRRRPGRWRNVGREVRRAKRAENKPMGYLVSEEGQERRTGPVRVTPVRDRFNQQTAFGARNGQKRWESIFGR